MKPSQLYSLTAISCALILAAAICQAHRYIVTTAGDWIATEIKLQTNEEI